MGMSLGERIALVVVMVLAVAVRGGLGQGGGSIPSCAQQLVPCAQYLNVTNPPESCCAPLRQAVRDELSCLCALYETPGVLQAFNITVPEALNLARRCGSPTDISKCRSTGALAPGASANRPPPATQGGGSHATHGATWIGMTGSLSLFLFLWSLVA